jgi:hypothetical protein
MNLAADDIKILQVVHKAVEGFNNDNPIKDYITESQIADALSLLLESYAHIDYLKKQEPPSKYTDLLEALSKIQDKADGEHPEWCGSVARKASATIRQLEAEVKSEKKPC